tara:strand:- start:769 stop:882 length:114 start_codon:yes stop_codon:yes gene_type:complete
MAAKFMPAVPYADDTLNLFGGDAGVSRGQVIEFALLR